ncbi:MAG TPA: CapA family protein [Myxococcaceae bacterium]|jgi:poly-gamma-glutamate synthesis protein (capsule biosynthesis protein)
MSLRPWLLWVLSLWGASSPAWAAESRLLFVGDILTEQGTKEIPEDSRWLAAARSAQLVVGNLEGTLGESPACSRQTATESPCFAMPERTAGLLSRAGFTAVGLENNHAFDLGPEVRESTARLLAAEGLVPLRYESSPTFLRAGDVTVGLVSLSRIARGKGQARELPSLELAQKLRLARQLSNLVVVYVHWGEELFDWPHPTQQQEARWLVEQGADLIIGHHPHVVQPPECVKGRPVFYSVGNFRMRSRFPAGRAGLAADCRVVGRSMRCGALATDFSFGSSWPDAVESPETAEQLKGCEVPLRETVALGDVRLRGHSEPAELPTARVEMLRGGRVTGRFGTGSLVALEAGRLDDSGERLLFTVERRFSSLDGEEGLRPYVYEVRGGGLAARWRGSALSWPLVDARLLPEVPGVLCALHRMDSFVAPNPETPGTRVAAYRWAGFGFRGDDSEELSRRCEALMQLR